MSPKRVFKVLAVFTIVASLFVFNGAEPSCAVAKKPAKKKPSATQTSVVNADTSVGSIITFGRYEQDNKGSNGKEPIEWVVLAKANNRVLVISRYVLDSQPYNDTGDKDWEDCSLRRWLNNTFINSAFSASEQARIPSVSLKNFSVNIAAGDEYPQNPTQDKIFLLNSHEAYEYFSSDSERRCKPTAYAKARGLYANDEGYPFYWLRNLCVRDDGYVDYSYFDVHDYDELFRDASGVRPAMYINFDSTMNTSVAVFPSNASDVTSFEHADRLVAEGKIPMYVRDKGRFFYNPEFDIVGITGQKIKLCSQPNSKANVVAQISMSDTGRWPIYLGEWTHPNGEHWVLGEYHKNGLGSGGKGVPVWIYGKYADPMSEEMYAMILDGGIEADLDNFDSRYGPKIKGLQLGMKISTNELNDFVAKYRAKIEIDNAGCICSFTFDRGAFGAINLSDQEFVRTLAETYSIPYMNYQRERSRPDAIGGDFTTETWSYVNSKEKWKIEFIRDSKFNTSGKVKVSAINTSSFN